MGAVIPGGTKKIAIHSASFDYASSIKRLISLLRRIHVINDYFLFSSIQLLVRAAVLPHSDPNPTDSIIFMCGDYSGGLFKLLGERLDLWRKPLRFDGSVEHSVESFTGNRMSVAIYLHRKFLELASVDRTFLVGLGFNLPSQAFTPVGTELAPVPRPPKPLVADLRPAATLLPRSEGGTSQRLLLVELDVVLNSAACAFDDSVVAEHLCLQTSLDAARCSRVKYTHAVHIGDFRDLYEPWIATLLDRWCRVSLLVPVLLWAPPAPPEPETIDAVLDLFSFVRSRSSHEVKLIVIGQDLPPACRDCMPQKLVASPFVIEASDFGKLRKDI